VLRALALGHKKLGRDQVAVAMETGEARTKRQAEAIQRQEPRGPGANRMMVRECADTAGDGGATAALPIFSKCWPACLRCQYRN
jgi:hypothetical protein